MSEQPSDVVEIDAIAVEEWDSEQHTPVHAESNLAELVKKSGLDAGWDVPTKEETSAAALADKPRTTTNTMRRTGAVPAMPSGGAVKVHKTMALPVAAVRPAAVAPKAEAKPAAPATAAATKPAATAKSATKTTATGVTPVVQPAAAPAAAKPTAKSATKTTATGVTPVVQPATAQPAAKPAAKSPTKT